MVLTAWSKKNQWQGLTPVFAWQIPMTMWMRRIFHFKARKTLLCAPIPTGYSSCFQKTGSRQPHELSPSWRKKSAGWGQTTDILWRSFLLKLKDGLSILVHQTQTVQCRRPCWQWSQWLDDKGNPVRGIKCSVKGKRLVPQTRFRPAFPQVWLWRHRPQWSLWIRLLAWATTNSR